MNEKSSFEVFEKKLKDLESGSASFQEVLTTLRESYKITSILYSISNAVSITNDLNELFESIHRILEKYIDATNFFISMVNEEKDRLDFPYYKDEIDVIPQAICNISDPNTSSLTLEVIRTGKPLFNTIKAIMANGIKVVGTIPIVWLGVPLIIKKKVIGAMAVQHYSNPDHYTEKDVQLMVSVSEQVAMAIERKKYEKALQENENIKKILYQISNAVSITRDLDDLFRAIHKILEEFIGTKNFYIALMDEDNKLIRFPYFIDEINDGKINDIEYYNENTRSYPTLQVLRTGEYLILNKEEFINLSGIGTAPEVWLAVPLKIKDKTIGIMATQDYSDPNKFTKEDLNIMVSVSEQVAWAVERKMNEDALRASDNITSILYRISNEVSTTRDLDGLFQSIHNILKEHIDATNFFIALYNNSDKIIRFEYFIDQFDEALPRLESLTEVNSLVGEIIIKKKPLFLNEEMLLKRAKRNQIIGTVPKVWLGVPLFIRDEVIGVVAVQSYQDANLYSERHLQVLSTISDQMAIAIHRKRAEDALRESEARYRLMANSVSDVVWTRDMALNLTYMSPSVEAQSGFSVAEKLAQPIEDSMPPDSLEKILHIMNEEIALEREGESDPDRSRIIEIENYRKDGTVYPIESVVSFMRDADGKAIAIAGINRDITERKKADEALRLTFETSPDVIVINRLNDGLFVDINQSFVNTIGYSREEVIGKTTLELNIWHDPTDLKRLVKELQREAKIANAEAKFRCKDGSIITGLMSASLIELNDQPHVINITRNIESIKKAQKEKAQLQAHLHQAQKMEAIGTLAGGIAHDFNNILSGILGYSELVQEDLNVLDCHPVTRERMWRVIRASLRAKDLVTQILDFSRSTRKDPTPISVILIVKEVLQLLRASLPSSIKIEQALNSNSYVMADPTSIHQILMNLCTNAKDAMHENGGTLSLLLEDVNLNSDDVSEYEGALPGHFLLISVKDTGHGMNKKVINRILEPFYTTKLNGKGTGMGLSVVHGIVKSLAGIIKISSAPEQGSRFDVLLPVYEKTVEPNHEMLMEIKDCEGDEKIMVIDDEKTLAEMLRDSLKHFGYHTTFFSSSEKALEHFKENIKTYDLIISDITMPEMTGDIFVEQIRSIDPGIPVILLTGFNESMNKEKMDSLHINALLYKPVPAKEMLSTIRAVLDRKI